MGRYRRIEAVVASLAMLSPVGETAAHVPSSQEVIQRNDPSPEGLSPEERELWEELRRAIGNPDHLKIIDFSDYDASREGTAFLGLIEDEEVLLARKELLLEMYPGATLANPQFFGDHTFRLGEQTSDGSKEVIISLDGYGPFLSVYRVKNGQLEERGLLAQLPIYDASPEGIRRAVQRALEYPLLEERVELKKIPLGSSDDRIDKGTVDPHLRDKSSGPLFPVLELL